MLLKKKKSDRQFSWEKSRIETRNVFLKKKKKCAPRGWKQRKTFLNAKMDSDVLCDLIKEQLLKHWFGLNVEMNHKP